MFRGYVNVSQDTFMENCKTKLTVVTGNLVRPTSQGDSFYRE